MNFDLVFENELQENTYIRITLENEDDLQTKINDYLSLHPSYTFCRYKRITCTGCLDNIANQEAHMYFGGCLYDIESENF